MPGSSAYILWGDGDSLLVSVDNRLVLLEGGEGRVVFEARPGNFFWHAVGVEGRVFVQEYGEPPTGIYVSEDLVSWTRVVDNVSIDKSSRHFHYIGYDSYRGWLIATLGDGNIIRVVYSPDLGRNWRPLYIGPWQFVPFTVLRDKVVFGFDSGIARGGVGVYYPHENVWQFKFFKPTLSVKSMHFSDLLYIYELGVYVAVFGSPQVLAVSRDLVYWHPILIEDINASYSYHIGLLRAGERIISWTGNRVSSIGLNELSKFLETQPITKPYSAYIDRLKGSLFMVKRGQWPRF